MGWEKIIENETEYIKSIGENLVALETMSSSNPQLEPIYAGLYCAYKVGLEQLGQLESDLRDIQKATTTGQLTNQHYAMLQGTNVTQERWIGALQIVGCLRCMYRPSDAFKRELRRQQQAIIEALQNMLLDPRIPSQQLVNDLVILANCICSLEHTAKERSWKDILTDPICIGISLVTGVGGYLLSQYFGESISSFFATEEEVGPAELPPAEESTLTPLVPEEELVEEQASPAEENEVVEEEVGPEETEVEAV